MCNTYDKYIYENCFAWYNVQSHPWEKTTWKTICIQNGREREWDGSMVHSNARIHLHVCTRPHIRGDTKAFSIGSISRCTSVCMCACVCVFVDRGSKHCRFFLALCLRMCMTQFDFVSLYLKRPFLMYLVVCVVTQLNSNSLTMYVYIVYNTYYLVYAAVPFQ